MPFSFTILPRKFGFSYFPFIQSLSVLRNQEESHSKVALAAPVKAYKQEREQLIQKKEDQTDRAEKREPLFFFWYIISYNYLNYLSLPV